MADRSRSSCSICERCPFDLRLCVADNWRGTPAGSGRVELNFRCPLIELRFEATYAGLGPWTITDLGAGRGNVAIADGHLAPPLDAFRSAAETFRRRGYFHGVREAEIVDAMAAAYRSGVPVDPVLPRVRRALANA